jgi:hypothetical protein
VYRNLLGKTTTRSSNRTSKVQQLSATWFNAAVIYVVKLMEILFLSPILPSPSSLSPSFFSVDQSITVIVSWMIPDMGVLSASPETKVD